MNQAMMVFTWLRYKLLTIILSRKIYELYFAFVICWINKFYFIWALTLNTCVRLFSLWCSVCVIPSTYDLMQKFYFSVSRLEIEKLLEMQRKLSVRGYKIDRSRFRDLLHNTFAITEDFIMDRGIENKIFWQFIFVY